MTEQEKQEVDGRRKISDKQLKKEIQQGRSYKEIASEYGYGYPSRALSKRIESLGFVQANSVSLNQWNGFTASISGEKVEQAEERKGFDLDQKVNYVVDVTQNGDFLVRVCENPIVEAEQ